MSAQSGRRRGVVTGAGSGIGIAPPHRLNENHFQATLPSLPDAAELLPLMP